ncbi:MAG: chitobiase/beta-hexosaminidase C-terminal domain-containing protein, partial [Planctomycetes bacterium]|nr:chitobiase/beta-hexosaminidase C-terminal domain-containing protein [Planctomycetota bacterium]
MIARRAGLVIAWGLVTWGASCLPAAAQEPAFVRGEVNQDGTVDISDSVSVLFHLFRGGFAVPCRKAADADDSGTIDITDALYGLAYIFRGGPPPPPPSGGCGTDPTPDGLDCAESRCGEAGGTLILSEIMASNLESLTDEDGDSSDWIEIHMLDSAPASPIDLGGWSLTGDPQLAERWLFPAGVTLERGGFLVVFASGKDRAVAGSELHTDFRLDAAGEYLALVAPDGVTAVDELAPAYPEQLPDVSYGPAQATTVLVAPGAQALYHVPVSADAGLGGSWTDPDFAPAGWKTGATGLGFSGIATEGFEVTYIKANVQVTSLTVAQDVLQNPARQAQVATETAAVIDYFNSGGRGNYTRDNPFPGVGFTDVDDYVVHVVGTVLVPQAGSWSFGVSSDDGFGMTLRRGAQTYSMSYPAPRGPADTIQVFTIAQAGPHDLDLLFYERGGGSEVELFAAKGAHPIYNANDFRLVGDTAAGGLGLAGFADSIRTDIGSEMRGANASLWTRIDFDVEDAGLFGGLLLRMRHEDGFVAFLNGQEVARRNAPAALAWDSRAAADRPVEQAGLVEEINLTSHLGRLRNGRNVLAVHGLNDGASDPDFLVLPELIAAGRIAERQYMKTPTPGAFNVPGAVDFVRDVELSVERGTYDAPFSLALSTPTSGAQIRYTRNGATPTATSGSVYSGPIAVNGTSVIRAAAFKAGHLDSRVRTHSYIFPSDVIRQSPTGQAPGPGWPAGSVNGQVLDYGMDPNVVGDPRWSDQIEDALVSIPSISLVTDLPNLFNASTGIYVNARNDGRAWERRTSVELIDPDGTPGFGLDAGLRIRGAFSRSGDNPKHSFRLFFRNEYGSGKLKHAMFGGEGVDELDAIDLKTSQNYSWAFSGSSQNTFVRDVFSRDVQRDMLQPYTRSRFYHLYLDGQYWGLYETEERADADYARSYLGGDEDDYDVVKNDSSGSRALHATDGTMDAYRRLYDAAVAGFATDAAYFRVLGRRPDGTLDPGGEQLLDPENLMDYMICTYYTGDPDAPVSAWGHISNNVFAIYNRVRCDGFTWYRHDAEHSLGANGGLYEARLLTDPTDRTIGERWEHFNPAWLHLRLTQHPEYLLQFADRVNKYFFNGGPLSPAANIERWSSRTRQIELAVIGASARWGDAKIEPPRTKDDWQREVDWMVSTYFPQRTQIVLAQMRSVDMFPEAALVSFNQHGGEVPPGFRLLMAQSNGTPGTIHYTLDGSDPRLRGGAVNPGAAVFADDTAAVAFIPRGSVWRYLDDGSDQSTAWRAPAFDDSG